MTNNFILSLIFSLIIFFGIYKDSSENNLQVAAICVEQNIIHFTGDNQETTANAWSLFKSLQQVKVHIIHQTENDKHTCFTGTCIHKTASGFTVRYCCVKRLLSILYTALFMLILYKFAEPIPTCYKNVRLFGKLHSMATPKSNPSI